MVVDGDGEPIPRRHLLIQVDVVESIERSRYHVERLFKQQYKQAG